MCHERAGIREAGPATDNWRVMCEIYFSSRIRKRSARISLRWERRGVKYLLGSASTLYQKRNDVSSEGTKWQLMGRFAW